MESFQKHVVSDTSERFLDLATKPLKRNHELAVRARLKISSKLRAGMDDELDEASKRLENSDRSKWKPAWVGFGLVMLGLGFLGLSALIWLPHRNIAKFMLGFSDHMMTEKERHEKNAREIAEVKRRTTYGLPAKDQMLIANQFDKLQEFYPSEPMYFAPRFEYECFDSFGSVKTTLAMLDRISKIDPDNGWWLYIAANVVSKNLDLVDGSRSRQFLEWEPEAQERVDLSLRLFSQAAAAPRFESYQTAIKSRKIALSPPADNVQDCVSNLISSYFTGISENYFLLDSLVATQAQKLADRNDIPGFRGMLSEWAKLSKAKANDFYDMDDRYIRVSSLKTTLPLFLTTARQLALHQEAQALEKSIALLDQQDRPFPTNKAYQQALRLHGSFLTSAVTTRMYGCGLAGDYFYGRYPTMTKDRLKPNRRAEHAYTTQLLILPLGLLLLTASACLFIFGFVNDKLCRVISGRFSGLFDRSDWLHCVGLGVMLPIFYFAIVRYFTPFGGLDWYAGSDVHFLERTRFLLLFLLIVSCSLLVLRQRLRKRMSFFEFNDQRGRIGLILTIAGFAILPLLGCCFQIERDQFVRLNMVIIYPSLLVIGLLLIWLITLAIRFSLGRRKQALRRQILSRLMARTMIWAFALICATLPFHRAEEKFWMNRDTVIRADPEHPATTRYEWEVIQQMKSELLEIVAPLEAISR